MKSLLLLGSTGSVGTQTLDIVRAARDRFRVSALTANASWEAMARQVAEFEPDVVGLVDEEAAERLRERVSPRVRVVGGPAASETLAAEAEYDLAVHGIVGSVGVLPSVRVLERGRPLALANKESLVVAGEHLMELARSRGAAILPVDSEHSAIFQCLRGEARERVRRVFLTASGGPFRDLELSAFADVTPERALEHPTWDMGPRITVGSATLMNKALEVIEAHHLFDLAAEQIEVLVHRQSIVHSMVEFVDGSILAQMGVPDMRVPIQFALHWPDRGPLDFSGFAPASFRELSFEEVDRTRFPALELGFRCVREGADAGCVLNAADEVAVAAFLGHEIGFQEIAEVNRTVLDARPGSGSSVSALLESDTTARQLARAAIEARAGAVSRSARG